jgi:hypothetical protein
MQNPPPPPQKKLCALVSDFPMRKALRKVNALWRLQMILQDTQSVLVTSAAITVVQ